MVRQRHPSKGTSMNNIEIMRLALEALDELHTMVWGECPSLLNEDSGGDSALDVECRDAITALRQAIEQAQKQERALDCTRVACMGNGGCVGSCWNNDTSQERVDEKAKQRYEPCGLECDCTNVCKQDTYKALWQQMCERCDELDKKLAQQAEPVYITPPQGIYYTPPPRQWVGLTDEEIETVWDSGVRAFHLLARELETKLKEKNT
jgi:hypothetical protein